MRSPMTTGRMRSKGAIELSSRQADRTRDDEQQAEDD